MHLELHGDQLEPGQSIPLARTQVLRGLILPAQLRLILVELDFKGREVRHDDEFLEWFLFRFFGEGW